MFSTVVRLNTMSNMPKENFDIAEPANRLPSFHLLNLFMQTLESVYCQIWGNIWKSCKWVIDYEVCHPTLIFLKFKHAQIKMQKVKKKKKKKCMYTPISKELPGEVGLYIHSFHKHWFLCLLVGRLFWGTCNIAMNKFQAHLLSLDGAVINMK